jgi:hypothetical protein
MKGKSDSEEVDLSPWEKTFEKQRRAMLKRKSNLIITSTPTSSPRNRRAE